MIPSDCVLQSKMNLVGKKFSSIHDIKMLLHLRQALEKLGIAILTAQRV
jgi:hypothetical protein